MKAKKKVTSRRAGGAEGEIKEAAVAYQVEAQPMMRTQIYLTRAEHEFLQGESARRGEPMAAVIRGYVDEKMDLPEDIWENNPMLRPWPVEAEWQSAPDAAINHDHYLYGAPKKWIQVKGRWVEAPPIPEDYYENRESAAGYDAMLRRLDESQAS